MRNEDKKRFSRLLNEKLSASNISLGKDDDEMINNLKLYWKECKHLSIGEFEALEIIPTGFIFCCENTQNLVNTYGDGRKIKGIIE